MTARDSLCSDTVDRTTSVEKRNDNDATKHSVDCCYPVCYSFWATRSARRSFLPYMHSHSVDRTFFRPSKATTSFSPPRFHQLSTVLSIAPSTIKYVTCRADPASSGADKDLRRRAIPAEAKQLSSIQQVNHCSMTHSRGYCTDHHRPKIWREI